MTETLRGFIARCAPAWWLLPLAATALAYRQVHGFQLIGDARFLILENAYVDDLRYWLQTFTHDYFWSSSGNSIPYWRPVTKLSWLLEHQLFGDWSGGYQLVQLGWHLVATAGVTRLSRLLGASRLSSSIAGALFGLHPAAVEPVCLVMARSDVVCVAASLWAVIAWLRWRESRRAAWLGLHLFGLMLALGSKETAVVLAPLLFIWSGRPLRGAVLRATPAAVAVALYFALRLLLLGGQGLSLAWQPLRWLAVTSVYLSNLIPFRMDSSVHSVSWLEAASPLFLLKAIVTAGCFLGIGYWLWRRDSQTRPLLLWIVFALAPVLIVSELNVPAVQEKYAAADRWLYHALPAASVLVGLMIGWLKDQRALLAAQSFSAVWVAGMLLVSAGARADYRSESTYLDYEEESYAAVPEPYRTREDNCRHYGRVLILDHLADRLQSVVDRSRQIQNDCGESTDLLFNLLAALVRAERYKEAEPVMQRLSAQRGDARYRARLAYLSGLVHLRRGRPAAAARELQRALDVGLRECVVLWRHAEALIALGQRAAAAKRLDELFQCTGASRPAILLSAAESWMLAGELARARQDLDLLQRRFPLAGELAAHAARLRDRVSDAAIRAP